MYIDHNDIVLAMLVSIKDMIIEPSLAAKAKPYAKEHIESHQSDDLPVNGQ